ncbi:MAG: hypothetical protein BMS9Abin02_1466 [Anaerolineae bacterium]|nr:MAG: hypothetical protein BMS9Abin02_1466 [Anaerolineae bacterium]
MIEYFDGEIVVIPSEGAWEGSTFFLQAPVRDNPEGQCCQFDVILDKLSAERGTIDTSEAMIC